MRGRDTQSFPIATSEVVYLGAYVQINTGGYLVNFEDTTGFENAGFVINFDEANADQTSVTGDNSIEAAVNIGGCIISGLSITGASGQTDVGALVYASDENTWTLTATNIAQEVGVVVRYVSNTDLDVLFFSLAEMRVVR
jgi:hypothetical protein